MCLVALAIDEDRRFPLVIASNRDEYFARPSARLAWWTAAPEETQTSSAEDAPILGGRDLEGGGTWLGLSAAGRLALVTNVRSSRRNDPDAPSRGQIVPQWLRTQERVDRFWMRTALSGYNGFNLIAADFTNGECYWASNNGASPRRLEAGLWGLSNGGLDSPWPKVELLKDRLRQALAQSESVDALANLLFAALGDRSLPPDDALPCTGVGLERERQLAPAFIRIPELGYGTRCSTLVITERVNRRNVTHVLERSFSQHGGAALLRRATLNHWPPRPRVSQQVDPDERVEPGSVSESEESSQAS